MKYFGMTDKGLHRRTNQDSYVIATNSNGDIFAIVADGIGGNNGGDIASRMCIGHFSKEFSETRGFADVSEARKWIIRNVNEANHEIYKYGMAHPNLKGMGTTLSGVMILSIGTIVVNIGDSRTYGWWRDGRFKQLTVDHSLVNDMLAHGELTPEEAENFPKKNVLTNALGVWESVRPDIFVHHEKIDGFLICSDGLHGYVPIKKVAQILFATINDPSSTARKLVKASLDEGGYDNVTVILINDCGGDLYG